MIQFHLLLLLTIFFKISAVSTESIRDILAKWEIFEYTQPGGTDKDTTHSYVDTYEDLLAPYRIKNIDLLEIGDKNKPNGEF